MTQDKKAVTFPKQQLEVVKYEADISYGTGGKTLDRLTAKNLSLHEGDPLIGKYIRYTVFNNDLRAHISKLEVGTRFLADVEERDRPDSEYGPDRNVVQVYQDGKPLSVKKTGGGGYAKSAATIQQEHDLALDLEATKQKSAEGIAAMAQVGKLLSSPTPISGEELGIDEESWNRIIGKYWQAVEAGLDNYLTPQPQKKPANRPATRDQRPPGGQGNASKGEAAEEAKAPPSDPIKNVGDLLTRAAKLAPPITRAEIVEMLSVDDPKDITNLEAAWKEIQARSAWKTTERAPDNGVQKTLS